jgi:ABC-type glutathione transport system ATPase component
VLFVSHDLGAIARLCPRAVWLHGGHIQADGPATEIVSSYLERATPGRLLDAEFDAEPGASAAVRRVTVLDAATGQLLTVPERGRPFTIEIAFEARDVIPDLNVALLLIDERA